MVDLELLENNKVDLRQLHSELGIGGRFRDYIKRVIIPYGFEEGYDYERVEQITGKTVSYEYLCTIDMAKELCMISKTPQGKIIRKYFIEAEKRLSPETAQQLKRIFNNFDAQNCASKTIDLLVERLSKKEKYIEQLTTVENRTVCLSDICAKFKNCHPIDVVLKMYELGMLEHRASGQYPSANYDENNCFIPCIDRRGRAYVRYTPKGEMIVSDMLLEQGYELK